MSIILVLQYFSLISTDPSFLNIKEKVFKWVFIVIFILLSSTAVSSSTLRVKTLGIFIISTVCWTSIILSLIGIQHRINISAWVTILVVKAAFMIFIFYGISVLVIDKCEKGLSDIFNEILPGLIFSCVYLNWLTVWKLI